MSSRPELEPGPKWWEVSDLTNVPSLSQVSTSSPCPFRSFTKTQFFKSEIEIHDYTEQTLGATRPWVTGRWE